MLDFEQKKIGVNAKSSVIESDSQTILFVWPKLPDSFTGSMHHNPYRISMEFRSFCDTKPIPTMIRIIYHRALFLVWVLFIEQPKSHRVLIWV